MSDLPKAFDSYNDGREERLLEYILSLPKEQLDDIRGNPTKVLRAIDDFSENKEFLMNIGPHKAEYLTKLFREKEPVISVELGGYIGYSAILFGGLIKDDAAAKYYSFESEPKFAEIARKLIHLAGLSSKVEVLVGKAAKSLIRFEAALTREKNKYINADFVLIDHWWVHFVPDLRVLESLNLIAPGTLIVADNIIHPPPGAIDYLRYVQGTPEERRVHNDKVQNINGANYVGRWNVLYDSETVPIEKTQDAVEVTRCVQYLNG